MAYIGNIPAEKFTSVDIQNFTVSATANYTLDRPVANENEIELFINNVRQHPGSGKAYTASGTALTLSEATAGTDTMYCVYQGKARQTVTPATSSVTNAMLAGSIDLTSKVTGALPQANIADQAINEAKLQISNAPTNGYMLTAQSGNTGGLTWAEAPSGGLVFIQSQSVSSNTSQINFDNVFSGTYGNYLFVWDATTNTDGADIHFNFRTTAPANHQSSYYAAVNVVDHLGNNDKYVQSNDSKFILAQGPYNQTSVDFPAASGYCVIQNPYSSSFRATMHMQNAYHTTNGDFRFGSGGLYINAQTQFGGFSMSASANDINNMTGRVYGIVNS